MNLLYIGFELNANISNKVISFRVKNKYFSVNNYLLGKDRMEKLDTYRATLISEGGET